MSFLNLMGNKLKPKEVNDALLNTSTPDPTPTPTPTGGGKVKTFKWTGDGNAPSTKNLPDDVGLILDIEQDDTGAGRIVAPFALKASGKYVVIDRGTNSVGSVSFTYSDGTMTFGAGAVGADDVFNRGNVDYTMYYLPIETD